MKLHLAGLAPLLLVLLAPAASAQAQASVAVESFDFGPAGTLLGMNGSGTGWAGTWDAGPNNTYAELAAPGWDSIGLRAHLNGAAVPTFRDLDVMQHPDIADAGRYGADDSTLWLSFEVQEVTMLSGPDPYFGGISLFDGGTEEIFFGVPWGTELWGIDDHNGGLHTVAGSDDDVRTTLVARLDFQPGDERVRLWVDPAVAHPTSAADIDITVPDFRFDRIRLDNSGSGLGSGARFDFDAIRLEKEVAAPGVNYCAANANSTGAAAGMSASGTASVIANDLVLHCDGMPANAFGFFLTSQTQGLVMNPGGSSGNLCLGGAIGRYVGAGQVQNSGAAGAVSLAVDLSLHPTPTGLVQVQAGQTWNFTCWFRDSAGGMATSNFGDGLEVTFVQ